MGVLAELFSRPLHRDGMRGDVLLAPPLGYARTAYADNSIDDSPWYQPADPTERAILGNKREQAAASMRGVRERRNAEPAAANAQRVLALLDRGPQNRRSLLQGLGLRAEVLDAALAHLAEAGLAEVEHKREHPKGGKPGAWWRRAANNEPAAPVPYADPAGIHRAFLPRDFPRLETGSPWSTPALPVPRVDQLGLDPEFVRLLIGYGGPGGHDGYNRFLRGAGGDPNTAKVIERMRGGFAQIPKFDSSYLVWRGINLRQPDRDRFLDEMERARRSGDPFEMRGFVSSVPSYQKAAGYAVLDPENTGGPQFPENAAIFEMLVNRGAYLGNRGTERNELILDHGSKFRVHDVFTQEGGIDATHPAPIIQVEQQ